MRVNQSESQVWNRTVTMMIVDEFTLIHTHTHTVVNGAWLQSTHVTWHQQNNCWGKHSITLLSSLWWIRFRPLLEFGQIFLNYVSSTQYQELLVFSHGLRWLANLIHYKNDLVFYICCGGKGVLGGEWLIVTIKAMLNLRCSWYVLLWWESIWGLC